ncbi:DsbA family protein [Arthrobacter mobilis]|uniref:Thioredoxin domain-containing protein n=1 Tax=Arthrobacter mobilis TaxID=2724944 RepID=A0A7X6K7Z5_9MICC|nr:thioredoxin domain-containing protein [Arthrobacter mobilis]NKX56858.1 thioredoxin domain-containing protein [Arthrobacter mobilis]
MPQNAPRPTKAERTAAAREKARQIREEQQRREKRNSLLLRWGIVGAVVAIIVAVALIVVSGTRGSIPDAGPAPQHGNIYGGYVMAKDGLRPTEAHTVDVASIPDPASSDGGNIIPAGIKAAAKGDPAQIVVYADMGCPVCKAFEGQYSEYLDGLVQDGAATVEYRVATFLDRVSTTNYSSRAANAVACVADEQPEAFRDYMTELFVQQPAEGGAGLDNATLVSIAESAGAPGVASCIEEDKFRPWAKYVNQTFSEYQVGGTPTVYVQGQKWDGATQPDFRAFAEQAIKG